MLFQMIEVPISADQEYEMIDITDKVQDFVQHCGIANGAVFVITEHTTTGITVNEKLPCVEQDIMNTLDRLVPEQATYHHNHYLPSYGTIGGNAPGHIKSLITGNHCVFPVVNGSLRLGAADSIYFCEYDGIKNRKYMLVAMGE